MTELNYDNFAEALKTQVAGFARVYDEHVAYYGEMLPHVLLGDLVRFLSSEVQAGGEGSSALREAMALLERGMGGTDPRLQELVAVSFIENLDPQDQAFPTIRKHFGPSLEAQYRVHQVTMGSTLKAKR